MAAKIVKMFKSVTTGGDSLVNVSHTDGLHALYVEFLCNPGKVPVCKALEVGFLAASIVSNCFILSKAWDTHKVSRKSTDNAFACAVLRIASVHVPRSDSSDYLELSDSSEDSGNPCHWDFADGSQIFLIGDTVYMYEPSADRAIASTTDFIEASILLPASLADSL